MYKSALTDQKAEYKLELEQLKYKLKAKDLFVNQKLDRVKTLLL